jgi:YHS domain-containing protein
MTRGHEGGCCGHEATQKADQVDPVCGNQVSDKQGYSKSYNGLVYRFCSRECLENFEATPEQFIKNNESGDASLAA